MRVETDARLQQRHAGAHRVRASPVGVEQWTLHISAGLVVPGQRHAPARL